MALINDSDKVEAYAARLRVVLEVEVEADRFGDFHEDMVNMVENYASVEYITVNLLPPERDR